MNSLLKRQIRKYLPSELLNNQDLEPFLEAIAKSYENFEEQSSMTQRAMTLSSEELFEANTKLKNESLIIKEVINKLKKTSDVFKPTKIAVKLENILELDTTSKLVSFINYRIDEIIKNNTQQENLLNDLAVKNQELMEYANMISHDLKSPLQNINTLVSWLKEDFKNKIDDAGHQNLELVNNNVSKMDNIINDILDYSSIGEINTKAYDVDLNRLLNGIMRELDVPKRITIQTSNKLPIITGDIYRLQLLFQNLIENAIEYNDKPNGLIEIGFENSEKFWQFYIKDNGKGIHKKYHEKIFQTFQKLDNTRNSTGMGLSIVKKIISFYSGKVWLESEENIGTTFYFTIKK